MLAVWALALGLMLAQGAAADVAGQSDPAFSAAFTQWLAGDEAGSVPALATLAQKGNIAAQLTLGMIDSTPVLQGDWLMAQDRSARIALLRVPGGISGGSWLAATDDPVAAGWLRLWDQAATPEVVLDFARLGEPRAARVAALALAARQVQGFAAVAGQAAYPPILQVYAVLEQQKSDISAAASGLAQMEAGDPQRSLLAPMPDDAALADWLARRQEGAPLIAFCAARCADEPAAACLVAAFEAVGGYHGLMRLGSPFEGLISSERFNHTPQGLQITLRRMQQRQMALGMAVVPENSACLATLLQ